MGCSLGAIRRRFSVPLQNCVRLRVASRRHPVGNSPLDGVPFPPPCDRHQMYKPDGRDSLADRVLAAVLAVLIAAWLIAYMFFAIRAGLAR